MPVDGLLLFGAIHIEPNDVVLHLGLTTLVNIQSAMHTMYPQVSAGAEVRFARSALGNEETC